MDPFAYQGTANALSQRTTQTSRGGETRKLAHRHNTSLVCGGESKLTVRARYYCCSLTS